jgi:hypothetical protein
MDSKPKSPTKPSNSGAAPRAGTTERRASPRRTPAKDAGPGDQAAEGPASLSQEDLQALIARAAYLRAEKRGFAPGHEEEDWLAAEAEVKSLIGEAGGNKR